MFHVPRNGCGGGNRCREFTHKQSIPHSRLNSMQSMYWPRAQAREETRTVLHCTLCSYESFFSGGHPNPRHRKRRSNRPSHAVGIPPEKGRQGMSFLEQKVEDLKLMVPGQVRRHLKYSLCSDANAPKDDADLAYGRYEPVYTEMELLDIYQDLLSTEVQGPEPVESATNGIKEKRNDRGLVHSLISRLNEHSPPEPGTSQSHATGIDSQGPVNRYRKTVSRLAAILQDSNAATELPGPSSSIPSPSESNAVQRILPSPLEWAAFIRECVSTLDDESSAHRPHFSDPCK